MMRKLPYGANYLNWDDMVELKSAIDQKILFRYQTESESLSTQFEHMASRQFGASRALAVHNCTEALRLCLLSTRPSVGDIVYIPAVTFVAVAGAVLSCGLIPILVDVDEDFALNASRLPSDAQRVIVAHMEGVVRPLPSGVPFMIEDAAQSMGGRHDNGISAGVAGYAGVFSFHHNKVLTSGEGGLILTNSDETWKILRQYHDHGSTRTHGEYPVWDDNTFYGENFVTSEAIAAIQIQQLRHLDEILMGLERGYRLLREQIPDRTAFRVMERRQGDVKVSIRLQFSTRDLRIRAEARLREAKLPYWTLSRYFLPDHPVIRDRKSIYADGFPWSIASGALRMDYDFSPTKERLERVICLVISPELREAEQADEASRFVRVLETL